MRYSNKWNTEYDAEKYNNTVEVSCGETIQQNGRAGVPSMSHALPSSAHFNFQFWFNINWDWTLPSSAHFNVHFWSIINWKWTLPSSVHLNILIQYQLKMVNAVLCWFQFSILIQYQSNEVHCPLWLKIKNMNKEATTMAFVFDLQTGPLFFFWLKKIDEREFNFDAKKVTQAFVLFKSGTLWYHF